MSKDKKYYQISDLYPLLQHPEKYKGKRPIQMRSSWETKFALKWLDININIIEWSSEEIIIKYFNPIKNRNARYFMDFSFKAKNKNGDIKEFWVEIKPSAECTEPKKQTRITKSYKYKIETYITNKAKWDATENLCESLRQQGKDITFMKVTEKDAPFFLRG